MLVIDGSVGEGGGQILRTSLALSLITGTPIRVTNIRPRRSRPGLMRQHLAAVKAAAAIGGADVTGAEVGSKELVFKPGKVTPGEYTFAVGTAGSATLVLQAVLPALLRAGEVSRLTLEGGTHNPHAPPFDFLERAFLPLVRRMGADVKVTLDSHGFYPAGGGRFRVVVTPTPELSRLDIVERGAIVGQRCVAMIANLPGAIAMRELKAAERLLGWDNSCFRPEVIKDTPGPGNVLIVEIESENVTEVFTGFGEKGVRAEDVAGRAAKEALAYLEAGVPVGVHLADQLLLPMALAGHGSFRTLKPSLHTTTHRGLLEQVLGARIRAEPVSEKIWHIEVNR